MLTSGSCYVYAQYTREVYALPSPQKLMSELGKIKGCYGETIESWDCGKKAKAVPGERNWPAEARIELDRQGKTFLSHIWQRSEDRLTIGNRSDRKTKLRLAEDAWSMIDQVRHAKHQCRPLPSFPLSIFCLIVNSVTQSSPKIISILLKSVHNQGLRSAA